MPRKLISEALTAETNANSIVSFRVNSFKLSASLLIDSQKSSKFLRSHAKSNVSCVDLLLNIPDKSIETLGCSTPLIADL